MTGKRNPRSGQKFDAFLAEEGLLEEVTVAAMKRVLAWEIAKLMKAQGVTKLELAKRMRTSRAALDRLLDPGNSSVTLNTMGRAAAALGRRLDVRFVKAA
jgi:DNA-binding Xre family transcriptional regulator